MSERLSSGDREKYIKENRKELSLSKSKQERNKENEADDSFYVLCLGENILQSASLLSCFEI